MVACSFSSKQGVIVDPCVVTQVEQMLQIQYEDDANHKSYLGGEVSVHQFIAESRATSGIYLLHERVADLSSVMGVRTSLLISQGRNLKEFEQWNNYFEAVIKNHPGVQRRV